MKTKCTLFNKKSFKDDLPLKLLALKIADDNIERKTAIKFLGVLLDKTYLRRKICAQLKLS